MAALALGSNETLVDKRPRRDQGDRGKSQGQSQQSQGRHRIRPVHHEKTQGQHQRKQTEPQPGEQAVCARFVERTLRNRSHRKAPAGIPWASTARSPTARYT